MLINEVQQEDPLFTIYLSFAKEYNMSRDEFDRLTSSQLVLADYLKSANEIIKAKIE